MPLRTALIAVAIVLAISAVAAQTPAGKRRAASKRPAPAEVSGPRPEAVLWEEYTYEVVASWPHDPGAFTQGLIWRDGRLYESTGLYGESSLREVDPETGAVLRRVDVPGQYFAEGLTEFDGKLFQLTWQHERGFVYDARTFAKLREFTYEGEGWGLTHDGESLVMSDGTNVIRFLDPETFRVRRTIQVTWRGAPVMRLNELEYIDGRIYANVWLTDDILRIDPQSGRVTGRIDMTGLLPPGNPNADVLNGIAYDAERDRILVTGKLWPRVYEVRFVPQP